MFDISGEQIGVFTHYVLMITKCFKKERNELLKLIVKLNICFNINV